MADLEKRDEYEQALMLILLSLFASESLGFWMDNPLSSVWFERQLNKREVRELLDTAKSRAVGGMLREIRFDEQRADIDLRIQLSTARVLSDLAGRLSANLADWRSRRYEALRVGEEPPAFDEIYQEYQAQR